MGNGMLVSAVLSDVILTHPTALQIILDLCIPEIELANTRSQISFLYFQSHSWNSVRNY